MRSGQFADIDARLLELNGTEKHHVATYVYRGQARSLASSRRRAGSCTALCSNGMFKPKTIYRYEDLTMGGSSQPKNTTTTTIT